MRSLSNAALALAVTAAVTAAAPTTARSDAPGFFVDLESGLAFAGRNDVAVPGDTGTRFSLAEDGAVGKTQAFVRASAGVQVGRHTVFATWQPLRLSAVTPPGTIQFAGQSFSEPTSARYRFDTYRLTYRYALVQRERLEVALGGTLLVRDAEIAVGQASKKNVGVVPLASFRVAWRFAGPAALFLDGDALAAPQGRAEDVAAGVSLTSGDLDFRLFYRVLEGGADNATVYNFALVHQPGVGVRYRF